MKEKEINEEVSTEEINEDNSKEETKDIKTEDKKDKKDKKAKKDKRDEKIEELEDKVMRQMAEFENFRKRTEKEKSQMYDMGAKSVIEKILPVIDNFERGLSALSDEEKAAPFADGMDKVYKQMMTELSGIGVEPIEALGCEFNPELHNAVMQVSTDEYESGIVASELQKGYKYHDIVVRHSMVGVAE